VVRKLGSRTGSIFDVTVAPDDQSDDYAVPHSGSKSSSPQRSSSAMCGSGQDHPGGFLLRIPTFMSAPTCVAGYPYANDRTRQWLKSLVTPAGSGMPYRQQPPRRVPPSAPVPYHRTARRPRSGLHGPASRSRAWALRSVHPTGHSLRHGRRGDPPTTHRIP
jgi:hypothetical protein